MTNYQFAGKLILVGGAFIFIGLLFALYLTCDFVCPDEYMHEASGVIVIGGTILAFLLGFLFEQWLGI